MRSLVVAAMAALTFSWAVAGVVRTEEAEHRPGVWSAEAQDLFVAPKGQPGRFPSPDAKRLVLMEDSTLFVEVDGRRIFHANIAAPAEILWAPDSSAFVVTSTDGGEEGTWRTTAYVVAEPAVQVADISRAANEAFLPRVKCADPEFPDIGALAWLGGSKELLLVAQVPSRIGCTDPGGLEGFGVEVPSGRILKTFSAEELKKNFRRLFGPKLRGN